MRGPRCFIVVAPVDPMICLTALADNECGSDEAFIFYIDNLGKVAFPDTKALELLMAKIGVKLDLKPQASSKLREFNTKAQEEFSKL